MQSPPISLKQTINCTCHHPKKSPTDHRPLRTTIWANLQWALALCSKKRNTAFQRGLWEMTLFGYCSFCSIKGCGSSAAQFSVKRHWRSPCCPLIFGLGQSHQELPMSSIPSPIVNVSSPCRRLLFLLPFSGLLSFVSSFISPVWQRSFFFFFLFFFFTTLHTPLLILSNRQPFAPFIDKYPVPLLSTPIVFETSATTLDSPPYATPLMYLSNSQ